MKTNVCEYCKKEFQCRSVARHCSPSCRTKTWALENPVRRKESGKAYYLKNADKINEATRNRRLSDPTSLRASDKKKYHKDIEKSRTACKEFNRARRKRVIEHYGGKCECCGEHRSEFLAIDHINNDGAEQRKIHGSGNQFYKWIIAHAFPIDLRVLCHNCNMAMGAYNFCPHMVEQGLLSSNDTIHLIESRRISERVLS
jgi:hypothetical protein